MKTHKRMQAMVPADVYDEIDRYCGQNDIKIGDFVRFSMQMAVNIINAAALSPTPDQKPDIDFQTGKVISAAGGELGQIKLTFT